MDCAGPRGARAELAEVGAAQERVRVGEPVRGYGDGAYTSSP